MRCLVGGGIQMLWIRSAFGAKKSQKSVPPGHALPDPPGPPKVLPQMQGSLRGGYAFGTPGPPKPNRFILLPEVYIPSKNSLPPFWNFIHIKNRQPGSGAWDPKR